MDTDAPNSGGSNASDFQPPTSNPQQALAQLFRQQSGIQAPTTQDILRNNSAEIVVPSNPAPPPPEVAEAKSNNWLLFSIVVIVVVLASLHFRRRWTIFVAKPAAKQVPEPKKETPVLTEATPKRVKSVDPKKKAARKAAKKRKRAKK